jgi:hypothetical protein
MADWRGSPELSPAHMDSLEEPFYVLLGFLGASVVWLLLALAFNLA